MIPKKFRVWDTEAKKMIYPNKMLREYYDESIDQDGDISESYEYQEFFSLLQNGKVLKTTARINKLHIKVGNDFGEILWHDKEGKAIEFEVKGEEIDNDRYVPLFSTGLKNENNKLVYEGDILRLPAVLDSKKYGVREVTFDAGGFYAGSSLALYETNNLEVIGNIYENPNLLK